MSRDAKPADVGYQRGKCGDATAKDDSRGVDGRGSNAGGATEPVASAVGAEGYPREARAGKRRGCARGGDEESRGARGRRGIILRANAEGVDGRRSHPRRTGRAGTGAPELGDELAFEREKYDIIPVPR